MSTDCDFLKLIKSRKTTYEFSEKKVKDSDMKKILEAGIWAPSSHNSQSWTFIVIKNKERIKKLMDLCYYGYFHTLPTTMVAIVGEPLYLGEDALLRGKAKDFIPSHKYLNLSLPVMNMCLQATTMKINTCIVSPIIAEANEILKVPKGKVTILLIGFGYEKKGAYQKPRERKKLEDVVHYEEYSGKKAKK